MLMTVKICLINTSNSMKMIANRVIRCTTTFKDPPELGYGISQNSRKTRSCDKATQSAILTCVICKIFSLR